MNHEVEKGPSSALSVAFFWRLPLVLVATACAHGAREQAPPPLSIEVSGSGTVAGVPDVVTLQFGVDVTAPSVTDAFQRAARSMDAMLVALRTAGVADKDMETTELSVVPEYDAIVGRQIIGFRVTNTATVKIRAIDQSAMMIDAVLRAGGNDARLNSLEFSIDDPSPLEARARKAAVEQAREQAALLASASGVRLGPVLSISGGRSGSTPRARMFRVELANSFPGRVPIQPGELDVHVEVRMVFRLDP